MVGSAEQSSTVDVAIVGAGPTGLLAALLLCRSGVSTRILDRSLGPVKESRAFAVHARTMELFQSLGLADRFLDRGVVASGAQIFVDGERAAGFEFDDLGRDDTPFPFVLMVPQSEVEAILVAELDREGLAVERGVEVTGLEQDADSVRLSARDAAGTPMAVSARYVVGADGAHSVVRKALGLTFEGAPYPQTFLLADCKVDWEADPERFTMFLHGDRFAIYFPLRGRDYARVIVTADATEADAALGSRGAAHLPLPEVEHAFRLAAQMPLTLSEPRWTSRYRVHHRGVNAYRVGRVFVAGDAAHIHSPAGGQGMNTGLQDAANLCWRLALAVKEEVSPAVLDTYDAERRPVGETVLAFTDRAFSFATTRSGWIAAIRDRILPLVASTISRSGAVRARAFHFISQLGIRYDRNALVADAGARSWSAGPPAGHRAPDAAIGLSTRIFDLIGGYRFHLLALSRTPLGAAEIEDGAARLEALRGSAPFDLSTHLVSRSLVGRHPSLIQAEHSGAFESYGLDRHVPQALYLVRPDGYVAWRAESFDVEGCRAFLARFRAQPSFRGREAEPGTQNR